MLAVIVASALAAACSPGAPRDGDTGRGGDTAAAPSTTEPERLSVFERDPDFVADLSGAVAWPPAEVGGGRLVVRAGDGQDVLVPAPYRAPDRAEGLFIAALVELDGPGQAGVFCGGAPERGATYVMWHRPGLGSPVTVSRLDEAGTETELLTEPTERLRRTDDNPDTALSFLCVRADDGVQLAYGVDALGLQLRPLDRGRELPGPLRAGVAVRGGPGGSTVAVTWTAITYAGPRR